MAVDDEGHNYTFYIPEVPWQKEYHGEVIESKPYLDGVRELLKMIMSKRHNPKIVWELASDALRLIDTHEEN